MQSLYSLSKNTVWIARTRKDEWWDSIGWFTITKATPAVPSPRPWSAACTVTCRSCFSSRNWSGRTLDAFRHYQISDGEIPFSYGMESAMRDPRYHCQHPLNPRQYAQMIYRLYLRSGDRDLLAHFYDSAKRGDSLSIFA